MARDQGLEMVILLSVDSVSPRDLVMGKNGEKRCFKYILTFSRKLPVYYLGIYCVMEMCSKIPG